MDLQLDPMLLYRLGVAIAIGFLVGLQREHASDTPERIPAGIRTFSLLGLAGAVAALAASEAESQALLLVALTAIGALIIAAYVVSSYERDDVGMTTEVAAVVVVLAGVLCALDRVPLALAIGVATAMLLSVKLETRTLAERLTRQDILATLQLAAITAIVLPLLPNQTFGPPPLDVLNPYRIWLLVVFISGISYLGYILIKLIGAERGLTLTGLIGGLASSTAVTLEFSRRSATERKLSRSLAMGILLAWAVMFPRVALEVAVVAPSLLRTLWLPLAAGTLTALGYVVYLYQRDTDDEAPALELSNPLELRSALAFGLFFAIVLAGVAAAREYLGTTGLYLSAVLAGLADVDAITLSLAETTARGALEATTATRAIILAAVSNTLVKTGLTLAVGAPELRRALLPGAALVLVASAGALLLV